MQNNKVNNHLLDCSDSHHFSSAAHKDRLGNCYTWIKADPTFAGLRHALKEFDERVFVGEEPDKLKTVRNNGTKYVKTLKISKCRDSSLNETWFDVDLQLNNSLVAIIGNKGSGKSALVDVLGLLGDTRQDRGFSFLNREKFKQPKNNKSQHFEATLLWESGKTLTKRLNDSVAEDEIESIKYIPQSFLERICNEVAVGDDSEFTAELETVIFSHVGEADRLSKDSLRDLISYKTKETHETIDTIKSEIREINRKVIELEEQSTPEHRTFVENLLKSKVEELEAHDKAKPHEIPEPRDNPETRTRISEVNKELEYTDLECNILDSLIDSEKAHQKQIVLFVSELEKALGKAKNLDYRYGQTRNEWPSKLDDIGLSFEEVITFRVNLSKLQSEIARFQSLKTELDEQLSEENTNSIVYERSSLDEKASKLRAKLDLPNKEYQIYLSQLESWEKKRKSLIGDKDVSGSLKYLKQQLKNLDKVPKQLDNIRKQRTTKVRQIYNKIANLADVYRNLHSPVQRFIENHPLAKGKFDLNFEVSIVDEGFKQRFFAHINHGVSGSFCGVEESNKRLEDLLDRYDFSDEESTIAFLDSIMEYLLYDKRTSSPPKMKISKQLRKDYTVELLYDFIFSLDYLRPHYTLKMDDKELHQLSPGERGTILLIFYLLIDKRDIPLVIDQPEENLDNPTIFGLLAPCIKEAKKKRQIFMVTHSPNIAVVCDAEQIIHASIDKKKGYRVTYKCGAIESPSINPIVVDVLEGTRPAFDNRESKYWVK